MGGTQVSKDDMVQFALRWLEPLKQGDRPYTYSELAKHFKRDRKTIAEGVQSAFGNGYVELVESGTESKTDPYRNRDRHLEWELRRRFPVLKEAIVLSVSSESSRRRSFPSPTEHGDLLHEQLGRAMAKFVVETVGFDLRERENFGFGSGRAVYYTVKHTESFTRKCGAIRVKDICLVSLCGDCQVKSETGSSPILDANYNANGITSALDGPYAVKPVMAESIAPLNIDRLRDDAPFATWPPTIALLGVGVLTGGHRFVNIDEIQAFVRPILTELKELNSLTKRIEQPQYCPVGDICNHLFRVPKPIDTRFSKDDEKAYDRIAELVRIINGKLLVMGPQELADKRTRLLFVAGGPAKAPAIKHLLSDIGLNVKVLCTDHATATFLART